MATQMFSLTSLVIFTSVEAVLVQQTMTIELPFFMHVCAQNNNGTSASVGTFYKFNLWHCCRTLLLFLPLLTSLCASWALACPIIVDG